VVSTLIIFICKLDKNKNCEDLVYPKLAPLLTITSASNSAWPPSEINSHEKMEIFGLFQLFEFSGN
jgi:hypothetical protein